MRRFLFLVAVVAFASPSAHAGYLDFSVMPTPGQSSSLAYGGTGGDFIGTNLGVSEVTGEGTPLLSGTTLPLTGAALNFTTGAFVTSTPTGWEFASGGSLSITLGSDTLFSGTFTQPLYVNQAGGNFKIAESGFTGTINPVLAAEFGMSASSTYTGALSVLFNGSGFPGSSITANSFNSGNMAIDTLSGTSVVPEPASAALMGIGFAMIGGVTWRVRRKRAS